MKKTTLIFLTYVSFTLSNLYAQKDITTGLKAYYPFSGNADDVSGNNYHGAAVRANLASDRFSAPSCAYDLNAANLAYISLPPLVRGLPQGSVALWFYLYSWNPGSNGSALYASGEVTFDIFLLGAHPATGSTQLTFGLWDTLSGWHWARSSVIPSLNFWHHVVATWGSNGMKIYVDNQFLGSDSYSQPVYTKSTLLDYVGASTFAQTFIDARVDEVRVYTRELTATDVDELFNNTSSVAAHDNSEIRIFPNPAKDHISVTGLNTSLYSYKIMDLPGKTVKSGILQNNLDLAELQDGIYYLMITDLNGKSVKNIKLIKQKD